MVKFQFIDSEVIEVEVDSILILGVQVEGDRPSLIVTTTGP